MVEERRARRAIARDAVRGHLWETRASWPPWRCLPRGHRTQSSQAPRRGGERVSSKSGPNRPIWVNSGTRSSRIRSNWGKFRRARAKFGRHRPEVRENLGRTRARFGQNRPAVANSQPRSAEIGPRLRPNSPEFLAANCVFDPNRALTHSAGIAQTWPIVGKLGPTSTQLRPKSGWHWPNPPKHGASSMEAAKHRRNLCSIWQLRGPC